MRQPVLDTWSSPTTINAVSGALDRLPVLVGDAPAVVVVDAHLRAASPLVAAAVASCSPVSVIERTPEQADLSLVAQIAEAAAADTGGLTVAIGGGSVLDVAKAGALVARYPPLAGLLGRGGLVAWPRMEPLRMIAVPTTTGTASEVSPVAILSEAGRPTMLMSPAARPMFALLDPRLLDGLGREQLLAGLVEPFSRALVPAVAGESLVLQDRLAGAVARALMELGDALPAPLQGGPPQGWGTAAALASAQTHTGFLALGRPPAAHALWPYATEIIAATGAKKPDVMAALIPAWLECLAAGELPGGFGSPARLAQVLGGAPEAARSDVARWCAGLGLRPVPAFDAAEVVAKVRSVWQASGLFLGDATDDDGMALLARLG